LPKPPVITRIEINQVRHEFKDIGREPGVNIPTYLPGARMSQSFYMTRMFTDQGIVGEYPARADISGMAELLIGQDALQRQRLYTEMRRFPNDVLGWVDVLLWDIAGKFYDASISELLGGFRKKLPAYASSMNGGVSGGLSTPESFADFAQHCKEIGYKGFKIHPYPRPKLQDHIDAVLALGERVGGSMDLMLDAYCYYRTFADALKVGRACDEAGFFWLEDPYFDGGSTEYGHAKLREFIKTPLLQGEKVGSIQQKVNLLLAKATDFVRGGIPNDGITGTMKLAGAADALGADIEIHGCGPAQRHAMSAIGNSNYYEIAWVHPDVDCVQMPNAIYANYADGLEGIDRDGNVDVPEGPGLGVEYDWKAIEKMTAGKKRHE
jgi:L-alanine-DL-glutamate epimerase-like enolase superfamily enzyme